MLEEWCSTNAPSTSMYWLVCDLWTTLSSDDPINSVVWIKNSNEFHNNIPTMTAGMVTLGSYSGPYFSAYQWIKKDRICTTIGRLGVGAKAMGWSTEPHVRIVKHVGR